jgi:hypothetical protein
VTYKPITEIAKLQLQQSLETYRAQMSLLVQISTVLVLADATTVGIAVQQQLAGIIWVGVIFPITIYLIIRTVFRLTLPVLATAVSIEAEYRDTAVLGLMSTFAALAISPVFYERIKVTVAIQPEAARLKALAALRRPSFGGISHTKWMLIVIIAGQLVTPVLLCQYQHWPLLIHKDEPQKVQLVK